MTSTHIVAIVSLSNVGHITNLDSNLFLDSESFELSHHEPIDHFLIFFPKFYVK